MGCSDPQASGLGRESINPAKMKLCLGCHNPFASSKLYKLFAGFAVIVICLQFFEYYLILLGLQLINFPRACTVSRGGLSLFPHFFQP